jgi:hypothetical protein
MIVQIVSGKPMTRQHPNVIATRVDSFALTALRQMAAGEGVSLAAFMRTAVARLASDPTGQAKALADLIAAIGLPEDAPRDAVLAAVKGLLDALAEPAPADPLQQAPDVPVELSSETLSKIKAKGMTVPQFLEAREAVAAAVKRSPTPAARADLAGVELSAETLKQIKARGMTVDEFLAARKAAVKRGE